MFYSNATYPVALMTIHRFFSYRLYRLSKGNWFIVSPLILLALGRVGTYPLAYHFLGQTDTSCPVAAISARFTSWGWRHVYADKLNHPKLHPRNCMLISLWRWYSHFDKHTQNLPRELS